ncbi:MAG: IS630 family transposase [Hyphomicrobiaceae bacterium]|nr:MAG: IS630 family transposase [Hyphomicrobiaceae bacterium]
MPAKKFVVELAAAEREGLTALISKGKAPAKTILKARILLKADQAEGGPGWFDAEIVEALDTNLTMVSRTREKLVCEGLEAVLTRKKRETPPTPPIFDGEAQAKLTALACSEPPPGHARWTIRLLAEHVVERKIVPAAHFNTVGRALKKNDLKPHLTDYWVIPPKANAAFVAAMEDVLDVYTRPHDPARPLVCLDETSKQLVAETRQREAMQPGQPARHDYEYKRNGTANLFMLFAPLGGWRHVEVTERRTAVDYAKILRDLADIHFPGASKIVLVQDNLNTHTPASLYEAFPPAEARRIIERFEWHYSPKHGSWLNLAESELAVLSSQCLARRIPDAATLTREVAAWRSRRNTHNAKANWHLTSARARVKLKSLYPAL